MTDTAIKKIKEFISRTITTDQAKDTGMAMVLICLLIASFGEKQYFYGLAILLLLINMIWPNVFRPTAKIWLGFSHLLGSVMSRIILGIIFLVLVLPVGFVRRAIGKDSLQLKKWKKDHTSVFKIREHEFTSEDIKHPY
jgi:multisubunit Na+/H+ antiporter MnhG subunit